MAENTLSVERMKEYLGFVIEFEKYVYVWSNAMDSANDKMRSIQQQKQKLKQKKVDSKNSFNSIDKRYENQQKMKIDEVKKYKRSSKKALIIFGISCAISILFGFVLFFCGFNKPICPLPLALLLTVIFVIAFFFLTFIGPISFGIYIKDKAKYSNCNNELKAFENGNIKKNNAVMIQSQIDAAEKGLVDNANEETFLKERQEEIFDALKEAKKNLEQIYALNILPMKYRSLNAATTLYQYLDTGRCTFIYGHGGIFDTYDVDSQRGIIIETLSDIKNTMYRIEDNQKMLFEEIQQANQTLSSINYSLEDIRNTNQQIANNTAISAEANRQTAACARWATWNAWAKGY